jgi:hypothetical protein
VSGADNSDAIRFEVVLEELRQLVKEFNRIGVRVVLVWGASAGGRAAGVGRLWCDHG